MTRDSGAGDPVLCGSRSADWVQIMKRCLIAGLVAISVVISAAVQVHGQAPSPETVARTLQSRYQGVRDFTADFEQTYRGWVLRTSSRERGTVKIKKPGRMRWVYTDPEKKEFVSDGTKVYNYIPADRQVFVTDLPSDDGASTSALFLTGRGDISRDFTAAFSATPVPGTTALKLTPRKPQPDYEYLIVAVDPNTSQLRALVTHDRQGGDATLVFSNMQENRQIADKEFEFRIPRGATVVTDDAPK
jgi:outer membrane lipoprotein carrier protein